MRAKKSLGQNFLKSVPALNKMLEAGRVSGKDTVLEIGPGKGALTEKLLPVAGKVIAIEKDRELFDLLKEKFNKEIQGGKLILVEDDILDLELKDFGTYKVVANIPYNITGAILKKFLSSDNQPELMTLMVQQEVAQRVVARDGKESILSMSVKAYGTPKLIMKVPARYFSPAPKVDSAILLIDQVSKELFDKNGIREEKFWEIVKKGFSHKRKKLSGNLKNVLKDEKSHLEDLGNKRAEELTLKNWVDLAKI